MLAFYILNFLFGLFLMIGGLGLVEDTNIFTAIIGGLVTLTGIIAMFGFTLAINNHLED